jgi:hypothetical protein
MNRLVASHLQERFPLLEFQLLRLQREHPDFKDLCQDHADCVQILSNISRDSVPDFELLREYNAHRNALEVEISGYLEKLRQTR